MPYKVHTKASGHSTSHHLSVDESTERAREECDVRREHDVRGEHNVRGECDVRGVM